MIERVLIRDNKNAPLHYLPDLDAFKNGTEYEKGRADTLKDLPRWRRIKERNHLPCRAYLYNLAYEVENNFLGKCHVDGFLVPNEAVIVGCDTWYLPVDDIQNLPKED